MICVPITAKTTEQALADMDAAVPSADLLELRLDCIRNPDLARLLAHRPKPVIVTITPKHENGFFEGSEEDRADLLRQAIDLKADYIDINLGAPAMDGLLKSRGNTKAIVSYHNYRETPESLEAIYARIRATGADIVKIAAFANRLSDNLRILDLIRRRDRDIIAVCMGPFGEISRILAPLHGAYLTFASLAAGRESAPGQIPADTLTGVYRLREIKPGFKLYGLVGNPVSKSKGTLLFNRLFGHHGLNSLYLNFLVEDIGDFTNNFTKLLDGFSITMPHKQAVMGCLDEIDPPAKRIGAVNTVVNRDGRLKGYNTDLPGATRPILEKSEIKDKNVTLLGAGGAARAVAVGIVESGGRLTILNRTPAKAERLAAELGCRSALLSEFGKLKTDILVNMTSVGMHPGTEETPLDPGLVKGMLVMDGIYNPARTRLLAEAEKNGCSIIPGTEMFIHQAAEQFRLWTGIAPDTRLFRKILKWN